VQVGAQWGFPAGARIVAGNFGAGQTCWTNLFVFDQGLTHGQVWAAFGDPGASPPIGVAGSFRIAGRSVTSWPIRAFWVSGELAGVLLAGLAVGVLGVVMIYTRRDSRPRKHAIDRAPGGRLPRLVHSLSGCDGPRSIGAAYCGPACTSPEPRASSASTPRAGWCSRDYVPKIPG
jgi:hypothetical protein